MNKTSYLSLDIWLREKKKVITREKSQKEQGARTGQSCKTKRLGIQDRTIIELQPRLIPYYTKKVADEKTMCSPVENSALNRAHAI